VLYSTDLVKRPAKAINDLVNLSAIPPKYYEFTDIFSKTRAKTLALYHLYDLQIKLEDGEKLFIETIYSLSTIKQEALRNFISENLNIGFIYSVSSSYRTSILFMKKMALFISTLTSRNLTTLHKRINIYFSWYLIFLTHLGKYVFIQRLTFIIYITWCIL